MMKYKYSNIRFVLLLLLLLLITFDPVTGLILINQKSQHSNVRNNLPSQYLVGGRIVTKTTTATFINRHQCLATPWSRNTRSKNIVSTLLLKEKLNNDNDDDSNNKKSMNPLTKSTWYAAEVFGNVVGLLKNNNKQQQQQKGDDNVETTKIIKSSRTIDLSIPPITIDETIQRIQLDNNREYFLSGTIDTLIYDIDCTFADPFVSFNGRDRFVTNLANLGSVITKYSAKPIKDKAAATPPPTTGTTEVRSKFMVKLELNLPWRPVLAWPWGVRCVIDPSTNLIVLHEESWDIDPWEGVKQVFRKPTTQV